MPLGLPFPARRTGTRAFGRAGSFDFTVFGTFDFEHVFRGHRFRFHGVAAFCAWFSLRQFRGGRFVERRLDFLQFGRRPRGRSLVGWCRDAWSCSAPVRRRSRHGPTEWVTAGVRDGDSSGSMVRVRFDAYARVFHAAGLRRGEDHAEVASSEAAATQGDDRNRTGVNGFAGRRVATPPRRRRGPEGYRPLIP